MRFFRILSGIGILLVLLLVVMVLVVPDKTSKADTTAKKPPIIQYIPGVPAVVPSQKSNKVANGTLIAVSSDDVRNFAAKFGIPTCIVVSGGKPRVSEVELVTAKQASVLMHGEYIGRPDNAMVYYVQVKGPFETNALSKQSTMSPHPIGELVFDAATGNLLVWGFPAP